MDLSPLKSLLKHLESADIHSSKGRVLDDLSFLVAYLMDPPQEFIADGTLKKFESLGSRIGDIISRFDLKQGMIDNELLKELTSGLKVVGPSTYTPEIFYDETSKPSSISFPRTAPICFLEHLEENLVELVKDKAESIGPLKHYILQLQRKLQFLRSGLTEMPETRKQEKYIKDLMVGITNLAYEVEFAVDSFLVGGIPIWHCMCHLRDILEKFEDHEKQVLMDSGDMESTVSNIINLVSPELTIIPILFNTEITEKLNRVFEELGKSRKFHILRRSTVSSYEERKREMFLELLGDVSYRGAKMRQYDLEASVWRLLSRKKYCIILEDVRDIIAFQDIRRVLPDDRNGSRVLLTTRSSKLVAHFREGSQEAFFSQKSEDDTLTSQIQKPPIDDDVVGFKKETEKMLRLLTDEPKKLCIFAIVGMAGRGKTTLANKLYSQLATTRFDRRAWCVVSQEYEKRRLILELLRQFDQPSHTVQDKEDVELEALLYKKLKGPKFLIVFDDVWSPMVLNDLRNCIPNENNGSRIIFTTRLLELASQTQSDDMLPLGELSNDESWELLTKKIFREESCPPELLEVGTQIAENCKGLPLSVVLVAGLLAEMERKPEKWEHIRESLGSSILGSIEGHGKSVIELSYKHLPDYLKPCFLYFGVFLEDKEVAVWNLIQLWIAEGFIKRSNLKSLEDTAEEDHLKNLIGRSLVTVAQEKSKGGVKTCRVHDLIRDFCLTKFKEENFFQLIQGTDPNSVPIQYDLRRLCIYSKRNDFVTLEPSGDLVRSLLFFAYNDVSQSYLNCNDISFISRNSRLLRILNLEGINIGDSLKAIYLLLHLRYLAIQGHVDSIAPSIANLSNLETFIVKGLKEKYVKVPVSIWNMAKLRHLHVSNATFDLNPDILENSSALENLQTFSTPSLTYGDDMEKVMKKVPNIQKLKCIFSDSWDDATKCNKFSQLGFLNELQSLNVFYSGMGKYPCEFNFPLNLKKLTLSNFRMPWDEILQLAKLESLEVLKLLNGAFEGKTWEMDDDFVFFELKFLKLESLNLVNWIASSDNFPCLEGLVLHKCEKLDKIPLEIGELDTLLMMEVMWCSASAAISATEIQQKQLDIGNDQLKFHVSHTITKEL